MFRLAPVLILNALVKASGLEAVKEVPAPVTVRFARLKTEPVAPEVTDVKRLLSFNNVLTVPATVVLPKTVTLSKRIVPLTELSEKYPYTLITTLLLLSAAPGRLAALTDHVLRPGSNPAISGEKLLPPLVLMFAPTYG